MNASTDFTDVECEDYLELLTAHLDGELLPGEGRQLDVHLDQCEPCREWLVRASMVTRLVRLGRAEPWPSITDAVVARLYSTN